MKPNYTNQHVLVLGLGETGLSVMRWLRKQGAIVSMADSRLNPPGVEALLQSFPDLKVHTGPFVLDVLMDCDLIVSSPGVPLNEPELQMAIAQGKQVIGDIELFALHRPAASKIIAITGSNGKTTVTTLVGEICKRAGLNTVVAGNIGLPVLDTLDGKAPDVYVLELSSFQLETTYSLKVDVATVLNISEDHMDRYPTIEAYARAKARIYDNATLAVVNRDDAASLGLTTTEAVSFGLNEAQNYSDFGVVEAANGTWLTSGKRKLMPVSDLLIHGQHNVANALAAVALCSNIGVDKSAIIQALRQFTGLPHRVEWVANINDIDFIDDSKGTNVGATCAAIKGMMKDGKPQKVVLLAGGDGKGQDFTPLLEAVQANARAVVLFGRDAPLIEAVLLASELPIYDAIDLKEAVAIGHKVASKGDAVLLSPACASFDMFKNYVHRAEVFIDAVKALEVATC
ncbi:MAG: UDP-N-acetylmuramoyl-L-alanine--D-glutamate ligase [Methylophilus sp.]|nr:UDP-N-acetylmuramoyl-L-alanine--D-glutamate ligase [Methylophilus sp.]